jgi:alpha-beta hydrolase superfamily lysophospholipase
MAKRKTLSTFLSILITAAAAVSSPAAYAEPVRDDNASLAKELKLPIYHWSDSAVKTKGIILAIHGVTLHARRFDSVAMKLAADGYSVFGLDLRGFGAWRKENEKFNGDDKIHYTQSQGDIIEVLSTLKKMYGDLPIYMMGESLGANLSVWVASTQPELIDGIILSSPCVKRIIRVNKRVLIDSTKSFFRPYKPFGLEAHIKPYLSEDPRVTAEYLSDPDIDMDLSAADLIKSVKTNTLSIANTKKIPDDMPILMLAGEQDKIYKAKAIPKFAKNIPSREQTIYMFENKGHLLLEHNFVEPDVMARMENWLDQQQKRPGKSGEIAEHNSPAVFDTEKSTRGSGGTVGSSSLVTPAPPPTR